MCTAYSTGGPSPKARRPAALSTMGTTPRYTSGERRPLSTTSASQAARRSASVEKSRKPKLTGFFTL